MRADVNLCESSRANRLRQATVGLAVTVLLMIVLAEAGAAPAWWVLLALPLTAVSLQVVQAYSGVCVWHARRGTRRFGADVEPILDPRKRALVRRRARAVLFTGLAVALLSTSIVVALVALR